MQVFTGGTETPKNQQEEKKVKLWQQIKLIYLGGIMSGNSIKK